MRSEEEYIDVICSECGKELHTEWVSRKFFKLLAKTGVIGDEKDPDGQLFVICDKCSEER